MDRRVIALLAEHGPRAAALWRVRMRAGAARGLEGPPAPEETEGFIQAVAAALESGSPQPLVDALDVVCADGCPIEDRLRTVLGRLDTLQSVAEVIAAEEAPSEEVAGELREEARWEFDRLRRDLAASVVGSLQQRLATAQEAVTARNASLSVTVHELRRPMTILVSYAQLLGEGLLGELPESAQPGVQGIIAGTEVMSRLISALAEVAHLEDPDDEPIMQPLNIEGLVVEAVSEIGSEAQLRRMTVNTDLQPGLHVLGDQPRLVLALGNVLSNAVKYGTADTSIDIRAFADDGVAHVVIRDHGPGFGAEEGPRLFEKYYRSAASRQTDVPGTGLGLFIVRSIMRKHGGEAVARPAEGGGAEFELTLPLRGD